MPTPLLETKFYVPRSRRGLVPRPRLSGRLDRGAESNLMLVSAPAGFGKTTLVAQWLAADPSAPTDEPAAAWLSLDQGDNDPASFWSYVVAALRRVAPSVGESALALLQEPPPFPIHLVLTTLINDLNQIDRRLVLVLDDYHVIEEREVQDAMAFLLDHLPPLLHLVIVCRSDPALPLARLRARGELVETRAADLRFTAEEAAAYLNEMMGLELTARDVLALEGRTEGWIAALQLAALSMQGRDDVAGFIAGFTGDDRYVVDYLLEEVLQRQPQAVQTFLLETSILGRLSGSLCDAVTGQGGGKAMLESLDRNNMFLVPLDDSRRWYRYHQLFADVLHSRLINTQPDQVPELHRRASAWYAHHGDHVVAIDHALAAEDFERAADLIELAVPEIRRERRGARLRGWLDALPDALIQVRPVLGVSYAGALLVGGELAGVEPLLLNAERWLGATPDRNRGTQPELADMVVVDEEEYRRLPSTIAVYRAAHAQALGDVTATVTYARRALDLVAEDDDLGQGAAAGFLALAAWSTGDLETAHACYTECLASLQRAGHGSDVLGGATILAGIRIAQGRLGDAMRIYERALHRAATQGGPSPRETADLHVGMSEILCERGDLAAAAHHLLQSEELGAHVEAWQNRRRWQVAGARIREAEGDLSGALDLLDQAERGAADDFSRHVRQDFSPDVRPVPALKARVWIGQAKLDDAVHWAREHGLSADDDLSYLREFEHITLARVLIAQYQTERVESRFHEAIGLLERLLRAADDGRRTGSVIEILVLQASAHEMRNDVPAALTLLGRALTLAEPEGYIQTFVGAGPAVAVLISTIADHGAPPSYVGRLLTAIERTVDPTPAKQVLVDPLSERERDVLRLLDTDLSGPQIARELVVSLSTVRTHTNSVYAKLGVNSRRAAVRRAAELDLLPRPHHR